MSSPLLRVKQAAMIIKEEINIPLLEMFRFSE
nr:MULTISPECIES: hypothetical protein [Lysinibacillus]